MNIEEMKSKWSGLNTRTDNIKTSINNKKLDGMKTAQQQLANQYRMFGSLGAVFTCLSSVIFPRFEIDSWAAPCIPLFFALCAVMDFILMRKVGEIDLSTMSVTEVAHKAASCRRLHHIFQLILIPTAIVLLAFLAYAMTDDKAFIYGMCIGAVIGLVCGLKAYFEFMNNYKSLIKQ